MKDVYFKAIFTNSDKVIGIALSDAVFEMGKQCAEEVPLAQEVGERLAFVCDNWEHIVLEIIDENNYNEIRSKEKYY